jgi:hypothetical protein
LIARRLRFFFRHSSFSISLPFLAVAGGFCKLRIF